MQVDVQFAYKGSDLPSADEMSEWARTALRNQLRDGLLTVRIVSFEEGARLNWNYRRQPGATNVLAFPFNAGEAIDFPLLGDVIICAPVARREAIEQRKAHRAHLAHLVVHGTLHLLGWEHHSPGEARRMEESEIAILAELGFPNPYEG